MPLSVPLWGMPGLYSVLLQGPIDGHAGAQHAESAAAAWSYPETTQDSTIVRIPKPVLPPLPFLTIPHGLAGKADPGADSRLHHERGAAVPSREPMQHVVQTRFQLATLRLN